MDCPSMMTARFLLIRNSDFTSPGFTKEQTVYV